MDVHHIKKRLIPFNLFVVAYPDVSNDKISLVSLGDPSLIPIYSILAALEYGLDWQERVRHTLRFVRSRGTLGCWLQGLTNIFSYRGGSGNIRKSELSLYSKPCVDRSNART